MEGYFTKKMNEEIRKSANVVPTLDNIYDYYEESKIVVGNLQQELSKYKEMNKRAIEYIKRATVTQHNGLGFTWYEIVDKKELLKILEVKE